MIECTKDETAELGPVTVVIDCDGLGYVVNISPNAHSAIQGKSSCKLYIYEATREGACVLYDFVDRQEWRLFLLPISVSGIEGNTTRVIPSVPSSTEPVNVISIENANMLKTVKDIGLKTMQRVIIDSRDKTKTGATAATAVGGAAGVSSSAVNVEAQEEAVAVLAMLGFTTASSQKVAFAILKEEPDAPVEEVIKLALKRL